MSKETAGEFRRRLVELRESAGLSTNKLAQKAAIDQSLLSKIERGERRPTDQVISKLSETLGVDYAQLKILADRDRLGPARLRAIKEAEELLGPEPWSRLEHEKDALQQELTALEKAPQDESAMVRRREIEDRLIEIAGETGAIQYPTYLSTRQLCDLAGVPVLTKDERMKLEWINQFDPRQTQKLLGLIRQQVEGLLLLLGEGQDEKYSSSNSNERNKDGNVQS